MTTGFVSRVKGKTQADYFQLGKGGGHQYVNTIAVGVQSTTVPNNGLTILTSTVGQTGAAGAVIALDAPFPGVEKTICVTTMSSGHIVVKTNSTGVVFFDAANSFWVPSTLALTAMTLSLMGVSTTQWAYLGTSPAVTSTGGNATGLQTSS